MIPLFFLHKRKEAAVFWWREGRRTQMGRTTSKKMIPLLLLRILWIHADKDHMISMEYIYVTDWRMNLNRKEGWGDRHCGNWYPLTFVSSIFFSMKRSGAWMRERNFRSVRKRLPTRSSPAATSRYIVWTTDCFQIRRYACCMTAYYFHPAWTMDVPVGFWTN